jgi:hypothetical protein
MTIQNRPEYCTREGGVSQCSRIRWRAYDALVPQIPVMLTMRYKNAWNLRIASQPESTERSHKDVSNSKVCLVPNFS